MQLSRGKDSDRHSGAGGMPRGGAFCDGADVAGKDRIRIHATEYTRAWIGEVEFDAVHATVQVLASRSTSPPLSATARAGESESSQPLWEPVRSADGSMSALWIARVQLPMQNPEDWRIMYGDGLLGIVSTSLREVALPPE